MVKQLPWIKMDKPWQNKGFTMVEMLLVLCVMQICLLLALPTFSKMVKEQSETQIVINGLLETQLQAIMEDDTMEYDYEGQWSYDVTFNRRGNVNMARLIPLEETDIIVSLGTGRIYEANQD